MSEITLVTGANDRYYKHLKKMLLNFDDYLIKRVIVYDLDINENNLNDLNETNFKNNIIIEKFNYEKYPDHVNLRKYHDNFNTYAWKPIIINEVCEKYKGIVFWFDTRNRFNKDITKLFDILKNQTPIYSPISDGTIKKWTYPSTLKYLNGEKYYGDKYLTRQPRAGGCFGVNFDSEVGKIIVNEWKKYALVKECIAPEGSDRSNHRQDQAILSILFYNLRDKFNFKRIDHYVGFTVHNSL
jgi:hypothetical protein